MQRSNHKLIAAAVLAFVLGAAGGRALTGAAVAGGSAEDTRNKIVPIITVGSSLNVGVARVTGEENAVGRVKAVAQLETDYRNIARMKILVPIASENVVQNIDRVPGTSVNALADVAIQR
jgi:hypothetical protein